MSLSRIRQIQTALQPTPRTPRPPARKGRRLGHRAPIQRHFPCENCPSTHPRPPLQYHLVIPHQRSKHPGRPGTAPHSLHATPNIRGLPTRQQIAQEKHCPWPHWIFLPPPQSTARRPPQSHLRHALFPMANTAHPGLLEAKMACTTSQNRRTHQHRRPPTHLPI